MKRWDTFYNEIGVLCAQVLQTTILGLMTLREQILESGEWSNIKEGETIHFGFSFGSHPTILFIWRWRSSDILLRFLEVQILHVEYVYPFAFHGEERGLRNKGVQHAYVWLFNEKEDIHLCISTPIPNLGNGILSTKRMVWFPSRLERLCYILEVCGVESGHTKLGPHGLSIGASNLAFLRPYVDGELECN